MADSLADLASVPVQDVIESIDPQILSGDELARLGSDPREEGGLRVTDIAGGKLTGSLDEVLHLTPDALATLDGRTPSEVVSNSFSEAANAASNLNSTQDYSIVAPGQSVKDGATQRRDMP